MATSRVVVEHDRLAPDVVDGMAADGRVAVCGVKE